jgi:hypothetical protein
MRQLIPLLLLSLLGACASPYRADVETHGDVKFSTDAAYFLVGANGTASVSAVDKSSGAILWTKSLPAGTNKAWKRSGKKFTEITVEEARLALGIR